MAKLINFKNNGKWGYYNTETHTMIPAQFQDDSDFVNGFAIVKQYSNSCYGVIDLIDNMGQELMPCDYTKIQFKTPMKNDIISSDTYEEPYDWKSDYRDAFEDEPGATWGREW